MYKKSVFIFRRDLRLEDNTALIEALKESEKVIPCFIFDPRQVKNNQYKSENALQFMINSLKDLTEQLKKKQAKLYVFYGKAEEVIKSLVKQEHIDAVFFNIDYTPFSQKRDQAIEKVCKNVHMFHDALLQAPGIVLKENNKPYTKFTAFYRKAQSFEVDKPRANNRKNYYTKSIKGTITNYKKFLKKENKNVLLKGGRTEALSILKKVKKWKNYEFERNFPAIKGTTTLSAHHKFGTVSIREVYHKIAQSHGKKHTLITELYWRDFFTQLACFYPSVFGEAFYKKYDKIKWDAKYFKEWCQGKTGFPIIDAGMRELNKTGYMHNRVRMIVASFLIKDLHIDWRWGENYFAQQLIDYDPAVNNGNWQWAASTGCDAQPYFRIFNPWSQQEKFDPECEYIKKWIPELKNHAPKDIHNLANKEIKQYSRPLVDHSKESKKAKEVYKKASQNT